MKLNTKKMAVEITSSLTEAALVKSSRKKIMKKIDVTAKKMAKKINKRIDMATGKTQKKMLKKEENKEKKVAKKASAEPAIK